MTPVEKEELKLSIQKKIKSTNAAIAEYKNMTLPIAPENAIGRLSRMDAINNKSVMEAALREAEMKLNRLMEALDKIETEDFGICINCKKPIPFNRLKAMPDANRCMNCAK